jgi:hypothetical protein
MQIWDYTDHPGIYSMHHIGPTSPPVAIRGIHVRVHCTYLAGVLFHGVYSNLLMFWVDGCQTTEKDFCVSKL